MGKSVAFGTSGWRGVIADDFTFERASLVTAAIATHLAETGDASRGVFVGYDGRFLAEEFARHAAQELSRRGIDVLLSDRMVPTPAVSHYLLAHRLGGAINFTASHNPGRWQGMKFNSSWGGPALPASTRRVEELCGAFLEKGIPASGDTWGTITTVDAAQPYLEALHRLVNAERIAKSGLPVLYDALHGAGAGYLDRFLEDAGGKVEVLHGWRDPLFGGEAPDPAGERLRELAAWAGQRGALGIATDGDADRFGVVGQEGEIYSANRILVILADYLLGVRKIRGDLARSVATTHALDDVAASYGRACRETPVGFKFIGEMIARGEIAMGGEESAGMSIAGHVPEKDGMLACLLVAEMTAVLEQPLSQLARIADRRFGARFSTRADVPLVPGTEQAVRRRFAPLPAEVGGVAAVAVMPAQEGIKWVFGPRDWALVRFSGTEPAVRIYIETEDPAQGAVLEAAFRGMLAD